MDYLLEKWVLTSRIYSAEELNFFNFFHDSFGKGITIA